MKKRISAAFAVIALLVTFLTAGSRVMAAGIYSGMTEEDAISEGQQFVTEINEIVSSGMAEMYGDGGVISAAFDSWAASMETLGVPCERVDLLDFETRRFQEHLIV